MRDTIWEDLLQLGVVPGDTVLLHSSFKSFNRPGITPNDFIQLLIGFLGKAGTLLMPSLSYEFVTRKNPCFDIEKTAACVGIIPETFRTMAGVVRSLHPTHSVCATGRLAAELTKDHMLDKTPCGSHSPFSKLPKTKGKILMLGCGLRPNTSMHAIEELCIPPYLFGDPLEYSLINQDGILMRKEYIPHNFQGWTQRYDRLENLTEGNWLNKGEILKAKSFLISAEDMWHHVSEKMKVDPLFFVDQSEKNHHGTLPLQAP